MRGRIEVGVTKSRKGRTSYLDEELRQIFYHRWKVRVEGKRLIPRRRGGRGR
jgi:hypothetical protein